MSVVMMCLFVIELIFSTVVENLALFAAAFHSFYDGAAMAIALVTLVLSKERPTTSYSYGLERVEIVAAFSNGALLIFVGLYIGFEAIEHLFEPPEELAIHNIALIGIIGLIVHLVAMTFFRDRIRPLEPFFLRQVDLSLRLSLTSTFACFH
jgi:cobalt-zinc-cadmium efflux system protein